MVTNATSSAVTPGQIDKGALRDMIRCTVRVDRSRNPREVLDTTGRNVYCDNKVVMAMPRGEGEEVEVFLFKLSRYACDDELEREYELHGLKPVDPYTLAAVNSQDPAFADEHPNGTHWKDSEGRWCFAMFSRDRGERFVFVRRYDRIWNDRCWLAGVSK